MNSSLIQLLVLAGIAIFLILRLRSVLGTREGFEKPPVPVARSGSDPRSNFEVIEGGPDRDITDHVEEGSDAAEAFARMKGAEPDFSLREFLDGARQAYEMILMAFENGDLDDVQGFLDEDVFDAFQSVIDQRADQGLSVEATFVGLREIKVADASFDTETSEAEISLRFVAQLTSVVRDLDGNVVEGSETEVHTQKDTWSFGREMGANDPNWRLVATGD